MKAAVVIGVCAGITLMLGMLNIWLGILALPVMYEVSQSLLAD